jgi:hypothetical protein
VVYEHPRGTEAHALAELLLPSFIGELLDTDVVAGMDDFMHEPAMQALTVGGKLAFLLGKSSPRGKIPLTILPGETLLAFLLDAALLVVVLRVVGTALPIKFAL